MNGLPSHILAFDELTQEKPLHPGGRGPTRVAAVAMGMVSQALLIHYLQDDLGNVTWIDSQPLERHLEEPPEMDVAEFTPPPEPRKKSYQQQQRELPRFLRNRKGR